MEDEKMKVIKVENQVQGGKLLWDFEGKITMELQTLGLGDRK